MAATLTQQIEQAERRAAALMLTASNPRPAFEELARLRAQRARQAAATHARLAAMATEADR